MTLAIRFVRPTCALYEPIKYRVLLRQCQQYRMKQCYVNGIRLRFLATIPNEQTNKPTSSTKSQKGALRSPPPSSVTETEEIKPNVPFTCPPPSNTTTATSSTQNDNTTKDATRATIKQKLSTEAVRQNVQGYVFTRYIDYVKNYDKVLEKNFPSAVKVYRVFFDGLKEFYADMKSYVKIWRIVNTSPQGLKALNRKELELFMQMPRDMVKVAPAIIGSSLPIIGYAIFPLVFMFPRTFLTSHFWTLQQRFEFQQLKLKERLNCNRPVFRCLQAKLKMVCNHIKHPELRNLLGLIGSGFHPNLTSILGVKDIFSEPPYNMSSLSRKHIKLLCQMHGIPTGWFKRFRLLEHAYIVHHMDLAIGREGGVHNMHPEAIRYACFIRGLNPTNLSNDEMINWLRDWILISTSIQEQHITLFLHLPILLAYNHPNNWQLIYCSNK